MGNQNKTKKKTKKTPVCVCIQPTGLRGVFLKTKKNKKTKNTKKHKKKTSWPLTALP
jgi:hypothetical protein